MISLPFQQEPDIGLGIAVRTFFDDDEAGGDKEGRLHRLEEFPKTFVPYAESLTEDFRVARDFVDALAKGVEALTADEMRAEDKEAWTRAQAYFEARPF